MIIGQTLLDKNCTKEVIKEVLMKASVHELILAINEMDSDEIPYIFSDPAEVLSEVGLCPQETVRAIIYGEVHNLVEPCYLNNLGHIIQVRTYKDLPVSLSELAYLIKDSLNESE